MCSVQYVGGTGQCFHERMNSHRADILHGKLDGKPVSRHFNSAGHSIDNMRVMIIDCLESNDDLTRMSRDQMDQNS